MISEYLLDYKETPFDDCDIEYLMHNMELSMEEQAMQEIYEQIDAEIGEMFAYTDEEVEQMEQYYLESIEMIDFNYKNRNYLD